MKPDPQTPPKKLKPSGPEQVADFLSKTEHLLKETMILLRQIILSVNPEITEQIKWNAPSFCIDGDDRITFNLSKANLLLVIFHKGAKGKETKGNTPFFKDETGLLEWLSNDRAVVKLGSREDLEVKREPLQKVVKEWIELTKV